MTSRHPKIFTAADPAPDLNPGDVLAVNHGNYQTQEIWVVDGANTGAIFPLGGLHHRVNWVEVTRPKTPRRDLFDRDHDACPRHPEWEDVVARGPVTVLTGMPQDAYNLGWRDGRQDLLGQIETLAEEYAPDMPEQGQPDVPAAKVGDLYGATATAIADNVAEILTSNNGRFRRAVGDERHPRGDDQDPDLSQEYDWVCVGYDRDRGSGKASGWATTEGLLDYAPLEVLRIADDHPTGAAQ